MINIGKYVNTHGIDGEIRIISNFSRKDLVFIPSMNIYIKDKEYTIESHRVHKQYDMLKLKDVNDINEIEHLKNSDVFVNEDNIKYDYLIEDYIDYKVKFNDKEYTIKRIDENVKYKIIVLLDGSMIPFVEEYIENVDNKNKCIYVKNVGGLIK